MLRHLATPAGAERYLARLREVGIRPTPADGAGLLFAPSPVVVARETVHAVMDDMRRFIAARRAETSDHGALLAGLPEAIATLAGGHDVAARIVEDLAAADPCACIDAFLVGSDDGLRPAYLEWQTFPAYPATAVFCLEALASAYPEIAEHGASWSPIAGEGLDDVRRRIHAWHVRGIEDDPRQGVIVDLEPAAQATSFEFDLAVRLTGGIERGLGVIDPREVVHEAGRPCYRRDGELIPIRAAFSRLVHGDMENLRRLVGREEEETCRRFFNDVDHVAWRVHPLHFLYGTKGDLPRFARAGLSSRIPACEPVTTATVAAARREGRERLDGFVQKPIEGHSGRGVIENPTVDQLEVGALLQRRIEAAACHPTPDGMMTPEIRVMGLPDAAGRVECAAVYTRVKSPDEFRSNAGAIARRNLPGTGEGFAIFVD